MRILRDTQVSEKVGLSRAAVWRKSKEEADFPKPVRVSTRRTGWIEEEVDAWIRRKVAESRQQTAV